MLSFKKRYGGISMEKNMKKILVICLTMVMALSSSFTIYAQNYRMPDGTNVREYVTDDSVSVLTSPRSALISSVSLELSQEGYRSVKAYSEILCHIEMKEIYMSISLQRLDGSTWKTINTKDFEWIKDDYPDFNLSMATASYEVGSLSAGKYRIRTAFSVYELDGSRHESRTSTSPTLTIN